MLLRKGPMSYMILVFYFIPSGLLMTFEWLYMPKKASLYPLELNRIFCYCAFKTGICEQELFSSAAVLRLIPKAVRVKMCTKKGGTENLRAVRGNKHQPLCLISGSFGRLQ